MSNEDLKIVFSGNDISPDLVPISELADLLNSIGQVVFSVAQQSEPGLEKKELGLCVRDIAKGSLKIEFTAALIAVASLTTVSNAIAQNNYSEIPARGRDALASIVKFTREKNCEARLYLPSTDKPAAIITPETVIRLPKGILGEITIYGKVISVGGKNPVVRIETISGEIVSIKCDKTKAKKLGGSLYDKELALSVLATISELDGSILGYSKIIGIDTGYEGCVSLAKAFEAARAKFGKYFADIDPDKFAKSMR